MKNPFLLFILWLFFFLFEILFPWDLGGVSMKPFGSYYVLGYALFVLPFLSSLLFGAAVFWIQSSYSHDPLSLLMIIALLYGGVFWVRRKTFSENLGARAITVFVVLFVGIYLLSGLQKGALFFPTFRSTLWGFAFLQWVINFVWAIFLFWLLEEPGAVWEDRFFSFRAKKGQLHLFEARHLRKIHRSPFKIQRRVRRRFGFKDSW